MRWEHDARDMRRPIIGAGLILLAVGRAPAPGGKMDA